MRRTFRLVRSARDLSRKGTAAIEFALLAPVLFLLMMGVSEIALVMLTHHLMENAVYNASRTSKTGYVESGKTQLETVQAKLISELNTLSPLIDVSKVQMTTTSFGSLSKVDIEGEGTTGLGAAEEVLVFQITYPWTLFSPLISDIIGDENKQIKLTSRIVVRNEPYE